MAKTTAIGTIPWKCIFYFVVGVDLWKEFVHLLLEWVLFGDMVLFLEVFLYFLY